MAQEEAKRQARCDVQMNQTMHTDSSNVTGHHKPTAADRRKTMGPQ